MVSGHFGPRWVFSKRLSAEKSMSSIMDVSPASFLAEAVKAQVATTTRTVVRRTPNSSSPQICSLSLPARSTPGPGDMVCYISNTPTRSAHDSHLD